MKRPLKKWLSLLLLLAAVVIVSLCYLTYNTYGNWSFALALRGKKLLAFIFVGIAAACGAQSGRQPDRVRADGRISARTVPLAEKHFLLHGVAHAEHYGGGGAADLHRHRLMRCG